MRVQVAATVGDAVGVVVVEALDETSYAAVALGGAVLKAMGETVGEMARELVVLE